MKRSFPIALAAFLVSVPAVLDAQGSVALQIKADQVVARVNPAFYGLMTEEINYSYDGGLYGELIRNRNFKEDAKEPVHWQLVQERGGTGSMALDSGQPFNDVVPASLKLTIATAGADQKVGIANDGFWGVPVKPRTSYKASFYAKAAAGFDGPIRSPLPGMTARRKPVRRFRGSLALGRSMT